MSTLRETVFDARDKLNSLSSMLHLCEQTISEIEHTGDEIKVKGVSSVILTVIESLEAMEKDFQKKLGA